MIATIDVGQHLFAEVAALTQLHEAILRKLVKDEVLPGVIDRWRDAGGTCDLAQARTIADRIAEARRPVEGVWK